MSFYEELLTLGSHLHDYQRAALYEFLLESQSNRYSIQATELLTSGELQESIAGGEIIFSVKRNLVTYSARKRGEHHLYENIREKKLGLLTGRNLKKIKKFIAQAEVEVIWNFPLSSDNGERDTGYTTISYPFSDLRYYSDGKSRALGLIKKLQVDNSEALGKLRAS